MPHHARQRKPPQALLCKIVKTQLKVNVKKVILKIDTYQHFIQHNQKLNQYSDKLARIVFYPVIVLIFEKNKKITSLRNINDTQLLFALDAQLYVLVMSVMSCVLCRFLY